MGRGVNKVTIIGNLGQDPDAKSLPSGSLVCNLRIATSESWKDKQTGEQKEQTEWHSVALFGKTAEIASTYLRKGSQVYVEGKLRTRKWQDKNGNDRYTTEIVGDQLVLLGGKGAPADPTPKAEDMKAPADTEPFHSDDIPFNDVAA